MVERNLGLDPEAARIGPKLPIGIAYRHPHRLGHPNITARRVKRRDADLIDGGDERSSAAVQDRRFRSVDLDRSFVDAEPTQCSQHVLGGRNQRARRITQNGRKFRSGNGTDIRANVALAAAREVGPDESYSSIGVGGEQRQRDRQS